MTEKIARDAQGGEDREPWMLPEGWCWTTLDRCIRNVEKIDPRTTRKTRRFDYIDLSSIDNQEISEPRSIIGSHAPSRARQIVELGDTLFSTVRVYLKNTGVVDRELNEPIASTAFCVLRPRSEINHRYLNYYVRAETFINWVAALQKGNSPPAVVDSDVKKQPFPLPPPAEQKRIVAKIDALFAEIEDGEAALAEARAGLETFRRSLLKAAVTGELTRDWRATNTPNETGHDLLARIKAERETQEPLKGQRKREQTLAPIDPTELPDIPETWAWARLNELGEFGRGKSKHRPRDDQRLYGGNMPFFQTGTVANSGDYIKEFSQTYSEFGIQQSKIWPSGTLCITIAANIANTSITTFNSCFPDSVVGLKTSKSMDPYWPHLWMQIIQKQLEQFAPATAQKNINLQVLSLVAVPIPPASELHVVLQKFQEFRFEMADAISVADAEITNAARLKQSVLKAAFEGKLVPQNQSDEPACALLDRLAATVSRTKPKRRASTRTKKAKA